MLQSESRNPAKVHDPARMLVPSHQQFDLNRILIRSVRLAWLVASYVLVIVLSTTHTFADDSTTSSETFSQQQLEFFESKVRPILVERCYDCHADGESEGGLSLESRTAMLAGGDNGPAIKPGQAAKSLIIRAIHYDDFYAMPPDSKLPAAEIETLEKWVSDGAAWPAHTDVEVATTKERFDVEKRKSEHWCWQPISPPVLSSARKPSESIDYLIQQQLDSKGLSPNGCASRSALLRRAWFDLVGLPPSKEHVQKFVIEQTLDFETVIDQLLDSPHFGERWARHWMDLTRYAETYGHEFDYPLRNAWKYRDYLIRAFNADVPYDDFAVEQIAGDLLPEPRLHPKLKFNESVIGTGFWFLGEALHAPVDVSDDQAKRIDNQIDVMTKSFLGLTVSCARCHDHKFDAIATKDFYALAGFLKSSRREEVVIDTDQARQAAAKELSKLREHATRTEKRWTERLAKTEPAILADLIVAAIESDNDSKQSVTNSDHPLQLLFADKISKTIDRETVQKYVNSVKQWLGGPNGHTENGLTRWDFADSDQGWAASGMAFDIANLSGGLGLGSGLRWNPQGTFCSNGLGDPFAGTVRSPAFTIDSDAIHVRIKSQNATVRLVVDGYFMHEFNQLLFKQLHHETVSHDSFQWLTLGKDLKNHQGHRAYLEVIDHGAGYAAIDQVCFSNQLSPPKNWPSAFDQTLAERLEQEMGSDRLISDKSIVAIIAEELVNALKDEPDSHASANFKQWIYDHQLDDQLPSVRAAGKRLRQMESEMLAITEKMTSPDLAFAISDGTAENEHIFIRGNPKTPGEVAPRQLLRALVGPDDWQNYQEESGSGRLRLAQQIASPDNPLTSRVIVNRVWHHLFGRGIVRSVDNFGVLGDKPSHPELLDHLATEFTNDGWSLKRLIRRIMLSTTWQMKSIPSSQATELDPDNIWLSHANIRRLQSEAIRDSMLAASESLDDKMFGQSVPVHLTAFMSGLGRPEKSGPLNGSNRRSIYVEVRRNFLSPMMLAFDTPIPFNAIGRRNQSNVPAQALILMNDPFVVQQAYQWANKLISQHTDAANRVEAIYTAAFARRPTADERQLADQFIKQHAEQLSVSPDDQQVWRDYCHVIFNTKEFIFLN